MPSLSAWSSVPLGRNECWISEELRDRVHAMFPHISAIGAGAAGPLQTAAAASVRRLAIDMDISHADRDQVMAFLAQNQSLGYLPKSGQITGILKQMKETMEGDSATAAEQKAIVIYDKLVSAKGCCLIWARQVTVLELACKYILIIRLRQVAFEAVQHKCAF